MAQADLDINRATRRILVKHWIDLGRISIRSIKGAVHLRGSLEKITGQHEDLSHPIIDGMFREIKRIKEVKRVRSDFDNWIYKDGAWSNSAKQSSGRTTKEEDIDPDRIVITDK